MSVGEHGEYPKSGCLGGSPDVLAELQPLAYKRWGYFVGGIADGELIPDHAWDDRRAKVVYPTRRVVPDPPGADIYTCAKLTVIPGRLVLRVWIAKSLDQDDALVMVWERLLEALDEE